MEDGGIDSDGRGSARAFYDAYRTHAGARWWRALALVGAGAAIEGLGILLLVPIIGQLADGRAAPGWAGLTAWSPDARLALLLGLFLAAMLLRGVILYARDTLLAELQVGFVAATRTRLMRRLAEAPWRRVAMLPHASVTNLMSAEIDRIAATAHVAVQGAVALAMLAMQGVVALLLAPTIAAGVAVAAGIALLLRRGRSAPARDLGGDVVRSSEALIGTAANLLGGLKAVAAERNGARFVDAFAAAHGRLRAAHLAFVARQARARLVLGCASAAAAVAVAWAGLRSGMAPEVLIALIVVFARMAGPAMTLQQALQSVAFGLPAHDAVRALEARLGEAIAPDDADGSADGAIVFDRASFLHPDGGGLREATLTIVRGEFVGVTGASGAGKTTLVDLIAGLMPPQSGEVRGVAAEAIAYVGQDGVLFPDTVRANLTWGADVGEMEIAAALAITGADRLVAAMAHGLETVIGERGGRLSGGERQRLAIARALLRRPRLLILDEATNALDLASEAELLGLLAALTPRPTIVLVAHRPESLAACDRVVTVHDGILNASVTDR